MPSAAVDLQIGAFISEFYADPLGFVMAAYKWNEPNGLSPNLQKPEDWQVEFLNELGRQVKDRAFDGIKTCPPIRMAVSSGHGVGKSTLVAWLIEWIMATRPHARGTITANTFTQLELKTWATIRYWHTQAITRHWFTDTTSKFYPDEFAGVMVLRPQSCREENSEAFAGQHTAESTSFYIFDEASAISDKIFEVAEGGLVKGEPMIFMFGNPTRSTGKFHESVFGKGRNRWKSFIIDARKCSTIDAATRQIHQEWVQDYGEDSDFVRVRVRGLPPRASDAQFIDQERVLDAQKRLVAVLPDEPLVAGADLAWGGGDDNVVRFRRGADGRSIPPIRIKGEFTRDPSVLTNRLADVLSQDYQGAKVHTLFLDSAGIAGPIGNRLRQMGFKNVVDVNFGAQSPDPQCRFMRDYMWQQMKAWLINGAIDSSADLEADLTGPGLRPDNQQRVWLESKEDMKKRGLDSPDDGDALALTFCMPVRAPQKQPIIVHAPAFSDHSWMGI